MAIETVTIEFENQAAAEEHLKALHFRRLPMRDVDRRAAESYTDDGVRTIVIATRGTSHYRFDEAPARRQENA